jgi:hypothetical protein
MFNVYTPKYERDEEEAEQPGAGKVRRKIS